MKKVILAIFCTLATLSSSTFAQAQLQQDTVTELQEVLITATRKASPAATQPFSSERLTQQTIATSQSRTTPEALFGATGVFVQKTNHGGGSPFVRGLTGNQTLLMIDGVRLNNATYRYGPNQYFNTIDPYSISAIEVVRGSGSVQYGSDALGGVIQVFSKDPRFSAKPTVAAQLLGKLVSQDMEYSGRGEVELQSKHLALLVGYTRRKFGNLVGGDTTGVQSPSGYQEQAWDAKLKVKLCKDATLSIAHQFVQQSEVPLYHRVRLENFEYYTFDPQQRQLTYAKLEYASKWPLLQKITLNSSFQQNSETRKYHKNGNAFEFVEQDKIRTIGVTLDVQSQLLANWASNTGVEFYQDKVKSYKNQVERATNFSTTQRGLYPNDALSSNLSIYHLEHYNYKNLFLEAGLRYQMFSVNIPDTSTSVYKLGNTTVAASAIVSNLGLLYRLHPDHSVYAAFNTGFRTPNIDDMGTLGLVDFRYEIPATGLKPEKSYNMEVGYKLHGRKLSGSFAGFQMQLADLITRVQLPGQQVGGYNVYIKENSQKSLVQGFEASLQYILHRTLTLKSALTYTYGQNESKNEPMRRIPPLFGRILLQYQQRQWVCSVETNFAGKQDRLAQGDKDDNRISSAGTSAWVVFNLYGGYEAKHYALRLSLQNLLNRDYRMHGSGINGAGRNVTLSVLLKL
jgi:hemoglobin/transferrin/lactoferrin receptor protein